MDEKISLEAIAIYSDAYADKVLKNLFSSKDKVTGREILSLSSVHQVNLFVVRELFKTWKEETRKHRSPYFDYDDAEVKEALETYMSVLSNHISIGQAHFAPLLKKAVSQTLLAIFNPYDFFSMLITGKNNRLEVGTFREEIKYLRVNKAPLERLLQKLAEKNVTEIPGNEAFAILDQILEEVNFTPEDVDGYIEKFSAVAPLNPSSFYVSRSAEPVPQKVVEEKKVIVEARRAGEPGQNNPTLNDTLNRAKQPAVIDNLRKISKIKESLSINQKFMFTKVLFYGDFESFSRAIDELDQLPDMKAALHYLEGHSSAWDRDSKEFHEFMELVEKRFS